TVRLLALEPLETREAPGSLLASPLCGNLFALFAGDSFAADPFAAASQISVVSESRIGVTNPEPDRPSPGAIPPSRDGGGAGGSSGTDTRSAPDADTPRAGGTGTFSFDTALFGDPFAIPGFGSNTAGQRSGGTAAGNGGSSPEGGGGAS